MAVPVSQAEDEELRSVVHVSLAVASVATGAHGVPPLACSEDKVSLESRDAVAAAHVYLAAAEPDDSEVPMDSRVAVLGALQSTESHRLLMSMLMDLWLFRFLLQLWLLLAHLLLQCTLRLCCILRLPRWPLQSHTLFL